MRVVLEVWNRLSSRRWFKPSWRRSGPVRLLEVWVRLGSLRWLVTAWGHNGPVRLWKPGMEMLFKAVIEMLATPGDEDGLTDCTDFWVFRVPPHILLASGGASHEEQERRNVGIRTSISRRTAMNANRQGR